MAENNNNLIERIRSFQFRLSRRVLHSWIRPTVLGCDRTALGLTEDDSVFYVMPYQSIADLMVVDKACETAGLPRPVDSLNITQDQQTSELESRTFFFLGHPEGAFGRKTQRQQSTRMHRLFEHQHNLDKPIKIVPVSIFWGHQPDKEQSVFKSILSENWTVTSRFKKILAALFHSNHILVEFSKPVLISDLIQEEPEPEKQRRKLLRLLRTHFTGQKQAILGPDLSHRRTLINSILTSDLVRSAIQNETSTDNRPLAQVEKAAHAYANELVSHQSYWVIRLFQLLLTWLWNKLYDGIVVTQVDIPKTWAKTHEIIYVPCHRSHIDYLLLSYVLYHNGLTPPHIAAGKNLNLPVIGPLLRRAGAFFMRRTFQGDALYKAIFDEYLHLMFVRGYSVEYFIEGGRSRTGRTLLPRTGMLSMTIGSFIRESSKPIAFLPVYFGYERLLEANTYLGELSGKSKNDESIFDVFGIFKSFKNDFGQVNVNFGEPVDLEDFLDTHLPHWKTNQFEKKQFSSACQHLGRTLAEQINRAAIINPVNLLATAILSTPRQAIERRRLLKQIEVLQRVSRADAQLADREDNQDHLTIAVMAPEQVIEQAIKVVGIEFQQQALGDVLNAPPTESVLLTYYRNNTIHKFVLPSLIARLIRFNGQTRLPELLDACKILLPYISAELFLPYSTIDLDRLVQKTLDQLIQLELVKQQEQYFSLPDNRSHEYAALNDLAEIVEPMLERFHIVMVLLTHSSELNSAESNRSDSNFANSNLANSTLSSSNGRNTMKSLEKSASAIAQQLSAIYGINSPEFFDQTLLSRFIATLNQTDCISTDGNNIALNPSFKHLNQQIDDLLDTDVRYNVIQAATASISLDSETPQTDSI